jgi:hypothetical protein
MATLHLLNESRARSSSRAAMNRHLVAVLSCCISVAASTQVLAQNVPEFQAVASSDVLDRSSMLSYREVPKADLIPDRGAE